MLAARFQHSLIKRGIVPRANLDALCNLDTGQRGKVLSQELHRRPRHYQPKVDGCILLRQVSPYNRHLSRVVQIICAPFHACAHPVVPFFFRYATVVVQG